jgi:hypothetical protein
LAKHRTIKAPNVPLLQQLATNEGDKWNSTWLLQQQKLSEVKAKQAGNDTASRRTQEALALMNNISTTLAQTLKRNDAINWDELKGDFSTQNLLRRLSQHQRDLLCANLNFRSWTK